MAATVVITGASTGIGAALATRYARAGARLGLIARNRHRLDDVAAQCRASGAMEVRCGAVDVRDRTALAAWLGAFDRELPVDVVVANAGILTGTSLDDGIEDAETSRRLYETNVLGVMNTIQPLIPAMVARRRGQIAIISSLAGFIPLPDMPSYSASKACVLSYGQSLRTLLRPYGVGVSVACPGFVATGMTDRIVGKKPFVITADEAAGQILAGLQCSRSVIVFPRLYGWLARFGGFLPESIRRFFVKPFTTRISPEPLGELHDRSADRWTVAK